ncbi:hypothetical protein HD597_012897 [Nonomuraea thailandensis]|uniref:Uncharacterized protein n=1 Tax=Nonomuraea thailandensis TaxID=1188745 RepID=A0A9X2H394_9ACTN|nr:hypothetical protein [Nonomuraea thailandensis]
MRPTAFNMIMFVLVFALIIAGLITLGNTLLGEAGLLDPP